MKDKEVIKYIINKLAELFLGFIITVLCKTLRISFSNKQFLDEALSDGNIVAAFWHGKMIVGWYVFRNKSFTAVVSQSKDGQILSNVLSHWNFELIRGSSHKGGKAAYDSLIQKAIDGKSIALTPDGPTGPINKLKAGAVTITKKSDAKLLLMGIGISKKIILKSWDKFEIPYPFAKVNIVFAEPLSISKDLTYEETDIQIKNAESILNQVNNFAESNVKSN